MNRVELYFLEDDLKEIDKSFESVKQILELHGAYDCKDPIKAYMVDKIYYANRGVLENHIEIIDNFISYLLKHAKYCRDKSFGRKHEK